jgi:energy-converting hydrogenase B subunit D
VAVIDATHPISFSGDSRASIDYEKDVARSVVLAGVESVFYALVLAVFLAPDLLIAYVAIGLGLNTAILLYVLSRGERYEEG